MSHRVTQAVLSLNSDICLSCDIEDIRGSLDVEATKQPTFIIIAAIDKNVSGNTLVSIPCQEGLAVSSYVYDNVAGCYRVSCTSYLRLGYVPLSYRLSVFRNVGTWNTFVPMPEAVLLRHFNPSQYALVTQFKQTYGDYAYRYEYLQIVDREQRQSR